MNKDVLERINEIVEENGKMIDYDGNGEEIKILCLTKLYNIYFKNCYKEFNIRMKFLIDSINSELSKVIFIDINNTLISIKSKEDQINIYKDEILKKLNSLGSDLEDMQYKTNEKTEDLKRKLYDLIEKIEKDSTLLNICHK